MAGIQQFGYRDTANLYTPLFEWTADEWLSGRVPLWCPVDGWGAPVVGDGTSSVFYPGKLVFLLAFLPFPVCMGLFVAGHVLLALLATLAVNVDKGKDNVGVNFWIEPRFLPNLRTTRTTGIEIPPAGAFGLE